MTKPRITLQHKKDNLLELNTGILA
jgi:hypothetical protein